MINAKPLAGLLVLDLSQGIAGPYCARLLGDHGARVLKVEPPGGDWMRELGPGPGATSASALYYNLGKESLVLDLKQARDLGRALALAARADVVIESSRPGAMAKLGLGFEAVRARNAAVIYLSISGFGRTGPRAGEPLTDTVAQAFSGYMSINRDRDGIPHKTGTTIIDAVTGLYAFQAVTLALWPGGAREARHLDVSLMGSAAAVLGPKVLEAAFLGRAPEIIAARLAERTTEDWVTHFTAAGVLASRINGFGDWLADPHVVASGTAPMVSIAWLTAPSSALSMISALNAIGGVPSGNQAA